MDAELKSLLFQFATATLDSLRDAQYENALSNLGYGLPKKTLSLRRRLEKMLADGKLSDHEIVQHFVASLIRNDSFVQPPFDDITDRKNPSDEECRKVRYVLSDMIATYLREVGSIQRDHRVLLRVYGDYASAWRG